MSSPHITLFTNTYRAFCSRENFLKVRLFEIIMLVFTNAFIVYSRLVNIDVEFAY